MAYATPNTNLIRPGKGSRIIHRRAVTTLVGGAGAAVGTAQVFVPPSKLIALKTVASAANAGTLTIKADTVDGVVIFTDGDQSSDIALTAVGTTAWDEGGVATAATDGFDGGFPVRAGVYLTYASGNPVTVTVDMWFEACTYLAMDLVSQSGVDGSGAVTRTLNLGGAGVLSAIAVDYQNMPATTDLVIKADSASGDTLLTLANSNTDVAPSLLGAPGKDEALNASAATDGTQCGNAFRTGLYFSVAQADAFTTGNEKIHVECWIRQ